MKEIIDSYCGLSCAECDQSEKNQCGGCIATGGQPFHSECEIAQCVKKKNIRFCGECHEIPCEMLKRYSHDEEHGDNPKGARIKRCKLLRNIFVKEARVGVNQVSYCGHHCDFCFYKEWCGGCRSDFNCCSFSTLFEDRVCPNVKCAKGKGLNGCYECNELTDCAEGFYSRPKEYVAKATALFIKKYGDDCYTNTLRKAIEDGNNYPKTFDESGSVEDAFAILEKYI